MKLRIGSAASISALSAKHVVSSVMAVTQQKGKV